MKFKVVVLLIMINLLIAQDSVFDLIDSNNKPTESRFIQQEPVNQPVVQQQILV